MSDEKTARADNPAKHPTDKPSVTPCTTASSEDFFVLPSYALYILQLIEDAGYEAWAAGGWVRDALLGNPSHDVDICSNAPWQATAQILRDADIEVHLTGTKHGTITAVCDCEPDGRNESDAHNTPDGRNKPSGRNTPAARKPVEITTYRVESGYSDARHPDEVRFVDSITQDLSRRDFTINAMAYHPRRGLYDPYDGHADLLTGCIRAVGDPYQRLSEDALRVLRALRFAARFDFAIEKTTQRAVRSCAPQLSRIAQERIGTELRGIIAAGRMPWALATQQEVMVAAIPEIGEMVNFDQHTPYHCYDLYNHAIQVATAAESFSGGLASERLRWASMFHDIAKPRCAIYDADGRGHFYGHPEAGAKMVKTILRRLALPKSLVDSCVDLVRFHDRPVKPTRHSVLRFMADLDKYCPDMALPLAFESFILKRSDALGKAKPYRAYALEIDKIEAVLRRLLQDGTIVYRIKDLVVSGRDIIRLFGDTPGPWVAAQLEDILREVVYGRLENTVEAQLAWLSRKTVEEWN